ncbi:MAG: peptide chain release factor 1 [Spirochaetota bacterium]
MYNLNVDDLQRRYKEIEKKLLDPQTISDKKEYAELSKEFNNIGKVLSEQKKLQDIEKDIREYMEILEISDDQKMTEDINIEIEKLKKKKETAQERLYMELIPEDPLNEKNIIIEIRAGTGGEEAALFAADLFRMYSRFAEKNNWNIEILSSNTTGIGGYKEIVFSVSGRDVYKKLKYEVGVHRVQRIPETESGGRIHTSAVTVAVLPEAEETEVEINPEDLRIDVFRASGHGGQHVNTTDSAVRITHLPTGVTSSCQDEKSQHKNKLKAMKVLRARLFEIAEKQKKQAQAQERRNQIGSGDRSERIRTYNFPQNRVTDHRIGLTLHSLDLVMDGDLEPLVDALMEEDAKKKLNEIGAQSG